MSQPWIYSRSVDSIFILLPAFLALIVVMLFPGFFTANENFPVIAWVVLILLIDVAHVYSTLYRTYFDNETFRAQRTLLVYVPLLSWIGGVILYAIDGMLFWRVLAYLAVYHFIRQQYGFMRIYSRKEKYNKINVWIDRFAIYYGAGYPVIFWHLNAPRNFDWFVKGDFYYFSSELLATAALVLYLIVITAYIIKETLLVIRERKLNVPRNAIITGTFLSWYFGIVYFNADLAFTTINVVAHGIPYMALVWIYGRKKYGHAQRTGKGISLKLFGRYGILLFLLIIFFLAFVEEGIWDAVVWKDHAQLFDMFSFLPHVNDSTLLAVIVPLLSLPQVTHYVLDGFIWKVSKESFDLSKQKQAPASAATPLQ